MTPVSPVNNIPVTSSCSGCGVDTSSDLSLAQLRREQKCYSSPGSNVGGSECKSLPCTENVMSVLCWCWVFYFRGCLCYVTSPFLAHKAPFLEVLVSQLHTFISNCNPPHSQKLTQDLGFDSYLTNSYSWFKSIYLVPCFSFVF